MKKSKKCIKKQPTFCYPLYRIPENLSYYSVRHNIQGITGPTGPTGPTGATGPAGEQIFARSTVTVSPDKEAKVISTHQGNSTYLDFFIPKGSNGDMEKFEIGFVETVEPNEKADVVDRYVDGNHYLDFKIPKGNTGEKGDAGPNGPKGDKGDMGSVGPVGPQGEQGETGPKGDKGEKGDTGPVGPQGEQGIQGQKGDTGEKGDVGPTGPKGDKGDKGDIGPRGLPGEIGISPIITIDATETVEPDEPAQVQEDVDGNVHHLTFYIPKGKVGEKGDAGPAGPVGPQGEQGEIGPKGDTGEKGDTGPKGEKGDTGPVGPQGEQGVQGMQGEKGDKGVTGATGAIEAFSSFIISYNDDPNNFPVNGKEIQSGERLPLMRLELDNGEPITLNSVDNTLKFNKTGVYFVTFTVNAYIQMEASDFNAKTDFVAIAFREVNSEKILAAANTWTSSNVAQNMFGQGMITVADTQVDYELVNLRERSIYINGADLTKTISDSYFSVPMVTLSIIKIY